MSPMEIVLDSRTKCSAGGRVAKTEEDKAEEEDRKETAEEGAEALEAWKKTVENSTHIHNKKIAKKTHPAHLKS